MSVEARGAAEPRRRPRLRGPGPGRADPPRHGGRAGPLACGAASPGVAAQVQAGGARGGGATLRGGLAAAPWPRAGRAILLAAGDARGSPARRFQRGVPSWRPSAAGVGSFRVGGRRRAAGADRPPSLAA